MVSYKYRASGCGSKPLLYWSEHPKTGGFPIPKKLGLGLTQRHTAAACRELDQHTWLAFAFVNDTRKCYTLVFSNCKDADFPEVREPGRTWETHFDRLLLEGDLLN